VTEETANSSKKTSADKSEIVLQESAPFLENFFTMQIFLSLRSIYWVISENKKWQE